MRIVLALCRVVTGGCYRYPVVSGAICGVCFVVALTSLDTPTVSLLLGMIGAFCLVSAAVRVRV